MKNVSWDLADIHCSPFVITIDNFEIRTWLLTHKKKPDDSSLVSIAIEECTT